MAINPALLVSAAMLQDPFVDNVTLTAMSGGVITCYQDNSRTTLKNWYYQSGSPGAYTYIALPNPMTLSAAGTIVDGNGNDTIPFYYPYSETDNTTVQTYYITVVDANGQAQFTRQNFPYLPNDGGSPSPGTSGNTNRNYIANNRFWRNVGTLNAGTLTADPITGQYSATLAPSQHDGFNMPDLRYIKNVNGATETITFEQFALDATPLLNDITPEFYINHTCTAPQAGETQKVYQFPISLHVRTLQNVPASFTIQAQNNFGLNPQITFAIYPYYGTGVTSPSPIVFETINLTSGWQKYFFPFIFPNISSPATLGTGGDDAYYLQIGMPLSATCNLNFTLPSIYLSNTVPTNEFDTYDDIDAIINTPRTGDLRTSINSFYPYGWVPLNGGSIGNPTSNATTRANIDTWPLFDLMWSTFSKYNVGTSNPIAQMINSSGSAVAYGGSAISDWNANNSIYLTSSMGRVILGTVPLSALLGGWDTTFTASSSGGLFITTSQSVNVWNGMTLTFSTTSGILPTGLTAGVIYYVANFNGSNGFNVATSFANAIAGTVIGYTNAGTPPNNVATAITGSFTGEYAHMQLIPELAAHTHTDSIVGAGSGLSGGTAFQNTVSTTGSTGSSTPFNVTQTSTFYNMFMKL
jgi:hypothetical protein